MRAWLLASFLGRYIKDYTSRGGLTTGRRLLAILLMAIMVTISIIFFIKALAVKIIVFIAGIIGCIVVGFVVPKAKY